MQKIHLWMVRQLTYNTQAADSQVQTPSLSHIHILQCTLLHTHTHTLDHESSINNNTSIIMINQSPRMWLEGADISELRGKGQQKWEG